MRIIQSAIIASDIINTMYLSTLSQTSEEMQEEGASRFTAFATLAILAITLPFRGLIEFPSMTKEIYLSLKDGFSEEQIREELEDVINEG